MRQTRTLDLWIEDGILWQRVRDGVEVTVADVEENVAAAQELMAGGRYATIADVRNLKYADRAARQRATREGDRDYTAAAMIVDSAIPRLVISTMLAFSKPSIPTRILGDEAAAVEWIRTVAG